VGFKKNKIKNMEAEKEIYDILIISFNSKLEEKWFVGFGNVNKDTDVNDALDLYNNFNNYIEPFKQEIIRVIGYENLNPEATEVLVGFKRDEETSEILYDFLMQVKKEVSLNKTSDLSNYLYAFEYDNCLEKIQINKDVFFIKNTLNI